MDYQGNSNEKLREHLANERTFLAWIRTSIALMGFGFVIVKFALFLKQISIMLEEMPDTSVKGYSAIIGIIMVALGIILAVLAFWQYKKVQKQLNSDSFVPSSLLSILLTIVIFIGGIILIIYLLPSI